MRNPQGNFTIYGPGERFERDTFTCVHCNKVVIVKPAAPVTESGGWCLQCSRAVCPTCAGRGCTPFEKKLAEYELRMAQRNKLLREMG